MFYEEKNSLHNDLFKIEEGKDFSFPTHLHASFELITVTKGEMQVTVEKTAYALRPGEAILVFPNQLHSLSTESHSEHRLCIFSPQYVRAYPALLHNSLPKSNLFVPTPLDRDRLFALKEKASPLQIKGLLYSLCAQFDFNAQYERQSGKEDGLLSKMFRFVEENYAGDCSLGRLADEISYHRVYLSRYFKKHTGLSFSDFVNRYRINEGCYRLKNSPKKILDLALECGFDSLRSFNRNFKRITGMTPKEYRQ